MKKTRIFVIIFIGILVGLMITNRVAHQFNEKKIEDLPIKRNLMNEIEDKDISHFMIKNSEGNYLLATINSENFLEVILLDSNFKEIKTITYPFQSEFLSIVHFQELNNQTYIIALSDRLITINASGEIIKNEGPYEQVSYEKANHIKDGFVLFGFDSIYYSKAYIFDNNGDLQKTVQHIEELQIPRQSQVQFLSDGGFVSVFYGYVTKYNESKEIEWEKKLFNDRYNSTPHNLIELNDGNLLFSGNSNQPIDDESILDLVYYLRVVKLNTTNGDIIWDKRYGNKNDYITFNTVEEIDNEIIVVGSNVSDPYIKSRYTKNLLVLKYDQNGTLLNNSLYKVEQEGIEYFKYWIYPKALFKNNEQLYLTGYYAKIEQNTASKPFVLPIEIDENHEIPSFNQLAYSIEMQTKAFVNTLIVMIQVGIGIGLFVYLLIWIDKRQKKLKEDIINQRIKSNNTK